MSDLQTVTKSRIAFGFAAMARPGRDKAAA
jgi:hypothetical protein